VASPELYPSSICTGSHKIRGKLVINKNTIISSNIFKKSNSGGSFLSIEEISPHLLQQKIPSIRYDTGCIFKLGFKKK
jgi:hypothetical protein